MDYIKHNGQFYKKIDLKELDKKELIKLLTEAIEVEPRVVERRHSYPRYNGRYGTYCVNASTNSIGISTTGTIPSSGSITSSFDGLDKDVLITMCSTL